MFKSPQNLDHTKLPRNLLVSREIESATISTNHQLNTEWNIPTTERRKNLEEISKEEGSEHLAKISENSQNFEEIFNPSDSQFSEQSFPVIDIGLVKRLGKLEYKKMPKLG